MAILDDLTLENLKNKGVEGFSFTVPMISQKWCDLANTIVNDLTFNQSSLTIQSHGVNWLAPFTAILQVVNNSTKKINFTLQKADGTAINENGLLLKMFPQQILRLKRLVRNLLEVSNTHNKQFANGIPLRQVPAFMFIATDADLTAVQGGLINAKENIGFDGTLYFFDEQGFIIHPLYVASICKLIIDNNHILNIDNALQNQLQNIIDKGATETNTARFIKADGTPYDGTHIDGVTPLDATIGLYNITNYTGTDATLKGEIKRAADTGNAGAFPLITAQKLLLGLVTYCRMSNVVNVPKLKDLDANLATNSIKHDFVTVKVVELNNYLLGNANANYNGSKLEPKPLVRLNEQLSYLNSGNAVMGKLTTIFSGGPTQALVATTTIDNKLPLPLNDTNIIWPAFPPLSGALTADDAIFPSNFKDQLIANSTATYLNSAVAPVRDVLLVLNGLPIGCTVRIYNRVFLEDANIERGDGAGATADTTLAPLAGRTFNGQATIVLKDPLGIIRLDGSFTVPTNPILICDIMVVERNINQKRLFGAVTFNVVSLPVNAPATLSDNILNALPNKGISSAGILGLQTPPAPAINFSSFTNFLNSILALGGEAQPRDANRLPTMMRKDLLAAAKKAGNWQALISAGAINKNIQNALQNLGCPGSNGGKENSSYGIYTQDAKLSYDIARMAFRRTDSFYVRIVDLAKSKWNEPAVNTALSETAATSASVGTFAGAVLQNISPFCETPELALLKTVVDSNINAIPATFDDLVNLVVGWINGINLGGLSGLLNTAATRLRTELVNALNNLKDNNALSESDKERLYNELKREISASCYGRRDSQWAIEQAFKNARNFIYIETPGLSFTAKDTQDYSLNLWNVLQTQLNSKPGLKVIICVPKLPEYDKHFKQWISSEVKERLSIIQNTFASQASQVVSFHPIGFPGRNNNIENNLIIVDDEWALIGSSAMRRRGLTFDGSSDIVFTDFDKLNGAATSIKQFRKQLFSDRLGVDKSATTNTKATILDNPNQTFNLIRQMLVDGGLGKIERLWNGRTEGVTFAEPTIDRFVANPDGVEFNGLETPINLVIAGLGT